MFIYQQGDVLRLYSGDFKAGADIGGKLISPEMFWLVGAIQMTIPVVMLFLSLTLKYPVIRWANIIVAIFWFLYNLIGFFNYPSPYDKFLVIVGLVINVVTVWYAWKWVA